MQGRLTKFPSPCGDYGSYRQKVMQSMESFYTVSVPLRGLWFLSLTYPDFIEDFDVLSFRPLAGIMVLIETIWILKHYSAKESFRPLAGIMVLIWPNNLVWSPTYTFPSPCGDYGSYHILKKLFVYPDGRKFPSPCGDYGSYLVVGLFLYVPIGESFRPLAGIMVLISSYFIQ